MKMKTKNFNSNFKYFCFYSNIQADTDIPLKKFFRIKIEGEVKL